MATRYSSHSENDTQVSTWVQLQVAPRWELFARRPSPYNSASPHAWRTCQDMTGGDTSAKRERSGQAADRAPSPEFHTKPLPTGIPVPQEMSLSLCTRYHYTCYCFSASFFFCTAEMLIFFFYCHMKKNLAFLLRFLSSCYGQINDTAVTAPSRFWG